jgi:phosphoribosylformimino-5-aminoimidazole carboxamide ribotide isomerase
MTRHIQIKEVDLDTVWRLRREVLYPERSIDGAKLENDQAGTHLGLYIENRPISVISFFRDGNVCRFRKFATLPAYQGKGYGSLLLEHIMELAESASAASIWCNARITAQSLYERFDMKPVGNPWEEKGYTYIKMEKQFS